MRKILFIFIFSILFVSCVSNKTEIDSFETVDNIVRKMEENLNRRHDILDGIDFTELPRLEYSEDIFEYTKNSLNDFSQKVLFVKNHNLQLKIKSLYLLLTNGSDIDNAEEIENLLAYYYDQIDFCNIYLEDLAETLLGQNVQLNHIQNDFIRIDDFLYDETCINILQKLIDENAKTIKANLKRDFEADVQTIFASCRNNVDNYLDWYYSYLTQWKQTATFIKGALNPKSTVSQEMNEFMAENYLEYICDGIDFEQPEKTLEKYHDKIQEQMFIVLYFLEEFATYEDEDCTGEMRSTDLISPFTDCVAYFEKVCEVYDSTNFGDVYEGDGVLAIDLVSMGLNFVPGIGFIAGELLDFASLKLTESIEREEFKSRILKVMDDNMMEVLNSI